MKILKKNLNLKISQRNLNKNIFVLSKNIGVNYVSKLSLIQKFKLNHSCFLFSFENFNFILNKLIICKYYKYYIFNTCVLKYFIFLSIKNLVFSFINSLINKLFFFNKYLRKSI
jgi:hypothetical protein